jgi:hypothetical protein
MFMRCSRAQALLIRQPIAVDTAARLGEELVAEGDIGGWRENLRTQRSWWVSRQRRSELK